MGFWDRVTGMFTGVGRKRMVPGVRAIVHEDGKDLHGLVLQDKTGSRRKRVRVQLADGQAVVAKRRNVTVD